MPNLIKLITPDNLISEKEKFFASTTYNPIFHYEWQDSKENITFDDQLRQNIWEAIISQNHLSITRSAQLLFEVSFDESTVAFAKSKVVSLERAETGSANEYANLLRDSLSFFDLKDIEVVISDQSGFNSRPYHKEKKIVVSKDIHFSYFSMEGGVHHELVHVLRYRNGRYNNIKHSKRYLPTEEGLASWCQDNANDDNGISQHAIEYLASHVGVGGSLRDIYNTMCDLGMESELAWKRASRHKFGFIDTSLPGDIMKPAMYFANEIKIAELSTNQKTRLFVGKINMEELDNYREYRGIWPEAMLTSYFHL